MDRDFFPGLPDSDVSAVGDGWICRRLYLLVRLIVNLISPAPV